MPHIPTQGRIQDFRQGMNNKTSGGGGGVLSVYGQFHERGGGGWCCPLSADSPSGGGEGCCPRACKKQGFWTKEGVVNPKTP